MQKEPTIRDTMLWVRIALTFNLLYKEIKRELSSFNLTIPQADIIVCLHRSKGLPLSELAERLLVTGGNITGVIDRLERAGYVIRVKDGVDRRVVHARLTPEGEKLYRELLPPYKTVLSSVNNLLEPKEQKELARILKKLSQGVRMGRPGAGEEH